MNTNNLIDSISNNIESLKEKILTYQSHVKKQRLYCNKAYKISKKEILEDLNELIRQIKGSKDIDIPMEVLILGKDLIGSSTWILHSYLEYLKSFLHFSIKNKNLDDPDHQYVIHAIQNNISIEETHLDPQKVFQCVFKELIFANKHHKYVTPLKCPQINTTIVLIPGIFNELYKTAAFERAALYLQEHFGIKYYNPEVHGRRSSTHNAQLIKKQLKEYGQKHPDEKFWILAHSKGGIDALHFLKENPEFATKQVVGLSTIAAPLMGSHHTNHVLMRLLQLLIKVEKMIICKNFQQKKYLMFKSALYSLSEKFQTKWFQKNSQHLPQGLFYSSLALESEWYRTNIWMLFSKFLLKHDRPNDGVVDTDQAHFPHSFKHINLGTVGGHHLVGTRSSMFDQETLLQTYIITLHYLGVLR